MFIVKYTEFRNPENKLLDVTTSFSSLQKVYDFFRKKKFEGYLECYEVYLNNKLLLVLY